MSLVIAAHNNNEIVIAFDSLSRSTRTGSREPDSTIEKVKQINPTLAYMMTGSFMNDKLQFIKDFADQTQSPMELDTAFWSLHNMATRLMAVYPPEGFRLGLAGFNASIPGFKCMTVEYGREIIPLGVPHNYYLSGEADPVILSEKRLKENLISRKPPTDEITDILSSIVKECIDTYPATLGDPVSTLVLSRPKRVKVKNGRHKR
jgi:hypothetical protein